MIIYLRQKKLKLQQLKLNKIYQDNKFKNKNKYKRMQNNLKDMVKFQID